MMSTMQPLSHVVAPPRQHYPPTPPSSRQRPEHRISTIAQLLIDSVSDQDDDDDDGVPPVSSAERSVRMQEESHPQPPSLDHVEMSTSEMSLRDHLLAAQVHASHHHHPYHDSHRPRQAGLQHPPPSAPPPPSLPQPPPSSSSSASHAPLQQHPPHPRDPALDHHLSHQSHLHQARSPHQLQSPPHNGAFDPMSGSGYGMAQVEPDLGEDMLDPTGKRGSKQVGRELSTSKRAAQNRAAQRAFRQRKEGYIKKLEEENRQMKQMFDDTYQASQNENYALRVYVSTLQTRLLDTQGDYPPPQPGLSVKDPREPDPYAQTSAAAVASNAVSHLQAAAVAATGAGGQYASHDSRDNGGYPAERGIPGMDIREVDESESNNGQDSRHGS